MASSVSQRRTLTPVICSAIARVIASRASSKEDVRDSGTPLEAGSSQA
jgi:hypothetical protein